MAKKSAGKSATGRPFQKGKDPRRGRGPEPGAPNAGRPPSVFLEKLAAIVTRDEVLHRFEEALIGDSSFQEFKDAFDRAADRTFGKPTQRQELTGADGGPIETHTSGDSPREQLASKLASINRRQQEGAST